MAIWKIAPGRGAEDWAVFRQQRCIGLGWELQDYRNFKDEEEVLTALEEKYGEKKEGYGAGAAEMIWSFVDEVEIGDIVIANKGYNKVVGIGVIDGMYLPPESPNNPMRLDKTTHRHHIRPVDWRIENPISLPGARFFLQPTLQRLEAAKCTRIKQAYLKTYPKDRELRKMLEELFDGVSGAGAIDDSVTREAVDLEPPERIQTTTYRIVRDTAKSRTVKKLHNYECQVCGLTINLPGNARYAEAHHIQPLGGKHKGPDVESNILCLCPNHHAELDLGIWPIKLLALRTAKGHAVDSKYVDYHNREIAKCRPVGAASLFDPGPQG